MNATMEFNTKFLLDLFTFRLQYNFYCSLNINKSSRNLSFLGYNGMTHRCKQVEFLRIAL